MQKRVLLAILPKNNIIISQILTKGIFVAIESMTNIGQGETQHTQYHLKIEIKNSIESHLKEFLKDKDYEVIKRNAASFKEITIKIGFIKR